MAGVGRDVKFQVGAGAQQAHPAVVDVRIHRPVELAVHHGQRLVSAREGRKQDLAARELRAVEARAIRVFDLQVHGQIVDAGRVVQHQLAEVVPVHLVQFQGRDAAPALAQRLHLGERKRADGRGADQRQRAHLGAAQRGNLPGQRAAPGECRDVTVRGRRRVGRGRAGVRAEGSAQRALQPGVDGRGGLLDGVGRRQFGGVAESWQVRRKHQTVGGEALDVAQPVGPGT